LVGYDDVINSMDYNWILKELLMQYRFIIMVTLIPYWNCARLKSQTLYN